VIWFFGGYNNHRFTKLRLETQAWCTYNDQINNLSMFSRIHRPSVFGIDEIATDLVEAESCDIHQTYGVGNTPLVWAVRNGHGGVVKIQLGWDEVNPDT